MGSFVTQDDGAAPDRLHVVYRCQLDRRVQGLTVAVDQSRVKWRLSADTIENIRMVTLGVSSLMNPYYEILPVILLRCLIF